jgi:hypothetical protein
VKIWREKVLKVHLHENFGAISFACILSYTHYVFLEISVFSQFDQLFKFSFCPRILLTYTVQFHSAYSHYTVYIKFHSMYSQYRYGSIPHITRICPVPTISNNITNSVYS